MVGSVRLYRERLREPACSRRSCARPSGAALFDHDLRSEPARCRRCTRYEARGRADERSATASSSNLVVVGAAHRRSASRASTSRARRSISTASLSYAALLPRPLPRRAPRRARSPCRTPTRTCCRSPALLTAIGADRDLPARPDRRVPPGPLDRVGVALFAVDAARCCAATTACSRATSTSSAIGAIVLLLLPALPGASATTVNGARLWVHVGPLQFQPGELAKIVADRLPRRLPAREARGARPGAAEGLRAAAR